MSYDDEHDSRLRDKLDTNGETFPLLDTESSTRLTNHGILNIGELEQLDDDVDVSQFLLLHQLGHITIAKGTRTLSDKFLGCLRRAENSRASRTVA